MIYTSQVLKMHPELKNFSQFKKIVQALGEQGEILIEMDQKPPYPDTPDNWDMELEYVFSFQGRKR
jgi:hypothetical protein